jgi:hypothetical protein
MLWQDTQFHYFNRPARSSRVGDAQAARRSAAHAVTDKWKCLPRQCAGRRPALANITNMRISSCQLIQVTDTRLKSILSHIQNEGKHDATAVFLDVVTVPPLATKL